jgi:hypothetical protein
MKTWKTLPVRPMATNASIGAKGYYIRIQNDKDQMAIDVWGHDGSKEETLEMANKILNALNSNPYPDTEADGRVFCGKCGKIKTI